VQKFSNAYKAQGWPGFWGEYLATLITLQSAAGPTDYLNNESLAYAYASTNNKDKALEYLEKAYDERDSALTTIKMSEAYEFLADEPRFRELIKKIGLPE
jgi:hypothetical protein